MQNGQPAGGRSPIFHEIPNLLVVELHGILVNCFLVLLPVDDAGLHEFLPHAQLAHPLRTVKLLLKALQCALDVISFFDRNRKHGF